LAGRLLARDWRSGEVIVLLASLVIAVAAMSAVTFFTDRVRQAVSQEAGESLAADLRIESVAPLSREYFAAAAASGVETAEIIHFRSVVLAGEASTLADVRGVTSGYPLRGEVRIADRLAGEPYRADGVPTVGEVWAEPSLLARLGAAVGDVLTVGALQLRVGHTLEFRPDEGWRLMEVAPTLLVNMEDLRASQLVQPGSIVEYEGLFAAPEKELASLRPVLESMLQPEIEIEDIRDARPEVRSSLEQAERFLVLSALVSVLLGGVAVAMSARRFVARRLDAVALMKCVGARYRDVLRLNLTQLLILVVAAGVIGSIVGYLAQFGLTQLLANFIETELPRAAGTGAVLGPLTALMVAIGFALPPLLQLGTVPPVRVLRKDIEPPPLKFQTIYGIAGVSVTAFLYLLFGDFELIAYVIGGALVTVVVLYGAGRLLVWSLQHIRGGVGVAWRYGIANVARRGRESSVQVVAFGIGLMVLLLLTLIRTELMVQWQNALPESSPNNFLINIQPAEREAVEAMLVRNGISSPQFTPLARARISHVNGTPVAEYPARDGRARRELNDEINLTWAGSLMPENEVVRGEWWDESVSEPLLSVEEELLSELGLSLGDELTYSIGGESITVRISNTRRVNWESFRPNFFMVVSPGLIENLPHTFITSFNVGPDQRGVMLALVREFPSVSVIDIGAVLDQIKGAMSRAALAVQYVFLFTIAAGIMVLLAAIQATRDERMFESAVLRTLGAKRSTVLQGVAAEFTALGMLAGALAALGAGAVAYLIATELFNLDYSPGLWPWFAGLGAGALIVGVCGTLAVRSVVNAPPVVTLRAA
jgi:putative ABC transport system permease protein